MRSRLKQFGLIIATFLLMVCSLVTGGLLSRSQPKTVSAATTPTTVTLTADVTELTPGTSFNLTVTISSTMTSNDWYASALYIGLKSSNASQMQFDTSLSQHFLVEDCVFEPDSSDITKGYDNSWGDFFTSDGYFSVELFKKSNRTYVNAATPIVLVYTIAIDDSFAPSSDVVIGVYGDGRSVVSYADPSTHRETAQHYSDTPADFYCNDLTFSSRSKNTEADLTGLSVGHGSASNAVTPVGATMAYKSLEANLNNFVVKPTASTGAKVEVSTPSTALGAVGADGTKTVTLNNTGETPVTIKVTSEDGSKTNTYTLNVTSGYVRLDPVDVASNTATSGVTKNGLATAFNPNTYNYDVWVPSDATNVTLTPHVKSGYGSSATVAVTKTGTCNITPASVNTAASGRVTVSNIATNDKVTLTATAKDGTTTAVYTFTMKRVDVSSALTGITAIGKNDSATYTSSDPVSSKTLQFFLAGASGYRAKLKLDGVPSSATVTVDGAAYSAGTDYGVGSHTVRVTAEAGNYTEYTVIFVQQQVAAEFGALGYTFTQGGSYTNVMTDSHYDAASRTFTYEITVGSQGASAPKLYINGKADKEITVTTPAVSGKKFNLDSSSDETGTNNKIYYYSSDISYGRNELRLSLNSNTGSNTYTFIVNYLEKLNTITNIAISRDGTALDAGDFTFNQATRSYTITVPNKTASLDFAVTTDGVHPVVYAGTSSLDHNTGTSRHTKNMTLKVGANQFVVYAKADEGTGAEGTRYTINVNREEAEKDNGLSDLKVKLGGKEVDIYPATDPNTPGFNPNETVYTVKADGDISSLTADIIATASGKHATIRGAGTIDLGTIASTGSNTKVISVVVTPEDYPNTPEKEYRILIAQEAIKLDSQFDVTGVTITGKGTNYFPSMAANPSAFSTTTYTYTDIKVPFAVDSVVITATTSVATAKLKGTGERALNVGTNTIEVWAEAEDGTNASGTVKYTFLVEREAAIQDAFLQELRLNGVLVAGFDKERYSYSASVTNSTTEVDISAVAEEARAVVSINVGGKTYTTGTGSAGPITIPLGAAGEATVVTVNVAIDDLVTPYTVRIVRASKIAELSQLFVVGADVRTSEDDSTLTIRDKDGNYIDGSNLEIYENMTDFYVEVTAVDTDMLDHTVEVTAIPRDTGAEVLIVGNKSPRTLTLREIFYKEDGSPRPDTTIQIICKLPEGSGVNVGVYYVHVSALSSSTKAEIHIDELSAFNSDYEADGNKLVYGFYRTERGLQSELTVTVNFIREGLTSKDGTYEIYYNDQLKRDENGVENEDVTLNYGSNYLIVNLISSDRRSQRSVVVLVERAVPGLTGLDIREIDPKDVGFDPAKEEYVYNVSNGVSKLTITPEVEDGYTYVFAEGDGKDVGLKVGENKIVIYVFEEEAAAANANANLAAGDGALRTITMTVVRGESNLLWFILFCIAAALCLILLIVLLVIPKRKKENTAPQIIVAAPAAPTPAQQPRPRPNPPVQQGRAPVNVEVKLTGFGDRDGSYDKDGTKKD